MGASPLPKHGPRIAAEAPTWAGAWAQVAAQLWETYGAADYEIIELTEPTESTLARVEIEVRRARP